MSEVSARLGHGRESEEERAKIFENPNIRKRNADSIFPDAYSRGVRHVYF